jgi:hypothetical protein
MFGVEKRNKMVMILRERKRELGIEYMQGTC